MLAFLFPHHRAAWFRINLLVLLFALLAAPGQAQLPRFSSAGADAAESTPAANQLNQDDRLINLQLRIAWGGGQARRWIGEVTIDRGRIQQVVPLGIEADEPGSIWQDEQGVQIQQRTARAYDALDLTVEGTADTTLTITLSPERADRPGKTVSVSLATLVADPHRSELDTNGNQLFIRRTPGDRLRVTFPRETLVFAPGDEFPFRAQPYRIAVDHAEQITLRARLRRLGGDGPDWQEQRVLSLGTRDTGTAEDFSLRIPETEGVYDLILSLDQQRQGLTSVNPLNPLQRRSETLLTRVVQLVVLAPKKPNTEDFKPPETVIDEINPAKPWWEKLTTLPEIPGLRKGPLDSGQSSLWKHPRLGAMARIGSGEKSSLTSWAAYPLAVAAPSEPHILEIEYPSNIPQSMGISIVEPNAAGAVQPLGIDSGVFVATTSENETPRMLKHRIPFWPRTATPFVLITNRLPEQFAVHGRIRLLGPAQFSVTSLRFNPPGTRLPPAPAPTTENGRELLAFYSRPLFPENFSARETFDPATERSLDSWRTFHDGGRRFVEYLQYAGYDGASISALSSGSAIYPSRLLEATPRYDTGSFFATGQDPIRKDVLEMMFQLFDREKLKLVPSLHFATPLPTLEATLRGGGVDSVGIELIGANGSSYVEQHGTQRGTGPHYNPLNPTVQRAVREVVVELAERYHKHPSFSGVTLQLSGDSFLIMPGEAWGFDDDTIARFTQQTGIQVPGSRPTRFGQRAQFLLTTRRAAWLAWRSEVLHDFYLQLHDDLRKTAPEAKLYLAADGLITSRGLRQMMQPSLPQSDRSDAVLSAAGILPQLYAEHEGICLLRPRTVAPQFDAADKAFDRTLNNSSEIDRHWLTSRTPGCLFVHQPRQLRLSSFDRKSPFGADSTFTWLANQIQPSDGDARRRFVRSLATLDAQVLFDGGWMLPMGQEHATSDVIAAYRNLPAVSFANVPGAPQPLVIRTARHDGSGYLYIANDSPWETTATLHVDRLSDWQELSGRRAIAPPTDGKWTITLRPYDLIAIRCANELPRITHVAVDFPKQAIHATLEQEIRELVTRAAGLAQGEPLPFPRNGGFEKSNADTTMAGWSVVGGERMSTKPDVSAPHQGQSNAQLVSNGGVASLISEPFDAPRTGRIAVSVWMRKPVGAPNPKIRIAVGARHQGNDYYRYANVPLTDRWEQYVFQIDDLPLTEIDRVQVRFDLMAAGKVSVDHVEVFDISFTENERKELSKIIALASFKLRAEKVSDCHRVLESYWPQFLMEHTELPAADVAVRDPVPRPAPAKRERPERTGGLWNNILPGFLR